MATTRRFARTGAWRRAPRSPEATGGTHKNGTQTGWYEVPCLVVGLLQDRFVYRRKYSSVVLFIFVVKRRRDEGRGNVTTVEFDRSVIPLGSFDV